jgi:hypothetical protein
MNKDFAATMIGGGIGIEQVYEAIDLLGEVGPTWKVAGMALKGLIMIALGYFAFRQPSIQTDVVAQFTPGPKVVPMVLLALLLAGCSAGSKERIEKAHMVFLEVVAGAKTVVVSGCEGLPTLQVAMDVVEPYMKGSDVVLMKVGEKAAVDVCAKIMAAQPSKG